MKNEAKQKFFGLLIFTVLTTFFSLIPLQAQAAINPQINFQGKLTNPDGTNIPNGSYTVRFRLYSDPTLDAANACGANSCMWEESKTLTVNSGIFQTALGDTTALPGSVDFNSANIHLGIKVGADAEMTPRVRFTASPYAFNAEKVGGLGVQQLVQLSPGTQQTGSINVSGAVTAGGTLSVTGAVTFTSLAAGVVQSDASGRLTSGTLTVANGGTGATSFNANGVVYGTGTALASTAAGTTGQCLIANTGAAPTWGSCGSGGGSSTLQGGYDGTASATPEIILDSTRGALTIRDNATAITGNLFEVQNNAGTRTYLGVSATGISVQNNNGSAFAFDSATNTMKIYENVASPTNFASISYASGAATFAASSGTTQIGNGSGNVTANLTGGTEFYRFNKTFTPSAAYSVNDFSIQRSLTGAANALGGSVLKIEDLSSGTASSPNVLSVDQNNTGATGNLIVATTGGTTTRFSVSTAGNGYFAGSLRVAGLASCASVQTDASGNFSCGAGGGSATTLQQAYTASGSANPQILLSSTGGGLKIQDAATSVGGNLFSVANNGGTITYFSVTTTSINIGVSDTNGTLLVLDTDTDATEPAGVNGAMYYNSSMGKFRCHEAGAWVNCISSGGGALATRSFVDTIADAVVDSNTTEYWDIGAENNNSRPNIVLSATGKSVWGIATIETTATGTQDVEVTARIERGIGAPPTCGSGTSVGGRAGTFASNTNATKTSTTQFIDAPATTQKVFYTVCSDLDTSLTGANISRIRVTLFELDNSNL